MRAGAMRAGAMRGGEAVEGRVGRAKTDVDPAQHGWRGDKSYAVSRRGGVFVLALSSTFPSAPAPLGCASVHLYL